MASEIARPKGEGGGSALKKLPVTPVPWMSETHHTCVDQSQSTRRRGKWPGPGTGPPETGREAVASRKWEHADRTRGASPLWAPECWLGEGVQL